MQTAASEQDICKGVNKPCGLGGQVVSEHHKMKHTEKFTPLTKGEVVIIKDDDRNHAK